MAQQGPPPPRSGRLPDSRSRQSWQDEEHPDEEEYPPWAGLGVIPRYADHDERERRRLGYDRPAAGRRAADPAPRAADPARRAADPAPHAAAHGRRERPWAAAEDGDPGRGPGQPGRGQPGRGRRERDQRPRGAPGGGAPGGGARPGSRSGDRAARLRRSRRLLWSSVGAVVVIVAAAVVASQALGGRPSPRPAPGGLVTSFQPGEWKTVPDACSSVSPATLSQYLPGRVRRVVPRSLFGRAQSLCDWSVDAPPMYRLLEVTVQAYTPSGLASGDGSATFAAIDAYQQAMAARAHPAKTTHLPRADITALRGLGAAAFEALQVPSAGGATTDLVTVVARQRNVLVTVVFDGLTTTNHRYGDVSVAQLRAGALAAARNLLSHLG